MFDLKVELGNQTLVENIPYNKLTLLPYFTSELVFFNKVIRFKAILKSHCIRVEEKKGIRFF